MTTLRVVLDLAQSLRDYYPLEVTRALIETAPRDCDVVAILPTVDDAKITMDDGILPGIASIERSGLHYRQLRRAWQLGLVGRFGAGLVHSTSMLAPLHKHERNDGNQFTVTIHDTRAWTEPSTLTPSAVAWTKAMMRRVQKCADAVVVPSHAFAQELGEIVDLRDRLRVIPGAGRSDLRLPSDADSRAERLGLPRSFVLVDGETAAAGTIESFLDELSRCRPDLAVIVWGVRPAGPLAPEARPEASASPLSFLDPRNSEDVAVLLSTAAAFVVSGPRQEASALDAMRLGTPIVHTDSPSMIELAGDAGTVVRRTDSDPLGRRLASALCELLADDQLRNRLVVAGKDRARAFSWTDTAQRIWQLHADL